MLPMRELWLRLHRWLALSLGLLLALLGLSGALLVLVILIALNLRPFLTAIGPLAPRIDARLALGVDTLAWVTLLPLLLIGVGVLLTPALLDKAVAGMDDALLKAVEAHRAALQQLTGQGADLREKHLKKALDA